MPAAHSLQPDHRSADRTHTMLERRPPNLPTTYLPQAHDPALRTRRWSIGFDTPPVGVFAARHGDTNFLDPIIQLANRNAAAAGTGAGAVPAPADGPTAVGGRPGAAAKQLPGAGAGAGGAGVGPDGSMRVLVGQLRGSLYALPADHVVIDDSAQVGTRQAMLQPCVHESVYVGLQHLCGASGKHEYNCKAVYLTNAVT